jgi:hypothetical protein
MRAAMPNSRALRPFSLNPTGTLSRRHLAHFSAAVDTSDSQDNKWHRELEAPIFPCMGAGAKVAGRSHDPPRRGDERSDRPSLWPRRAAAPPFPPVMVSILWRGNGHGLAFLGYYNERDRRVEAGAWRRSRMSLGFMSVAVAANIPGKLRRSSSQSGSRWALTGQRSPTQAGSSPRWTAPPCRMALISICMDSS